MATEADIGGCVVGAGGAHAGSHHDSGEPAHRDVAAWPKRAPARPD